ncbi:TraB/VirB10 family protein (plasmid) [Vibrio scophthalmi]|uniref:TraB/VirB10 family protein n=1 Tax=Vibrio scophthalmi TaxID=45658 RepID=UPI003EBECAB0
MKVDDLKALWQDNKTFRYIVLGCVITPIAWFGTSFIAPKKIDRPNSEKTKIEKVWAPASASAELERRDIQQSHEALAEIALADKRSKANNNSYEYDKMQSQYDSLANKVLQQEQELNKWVTGQKTLARTNYDPNQVRPNRRVVKDENGNPVVVTQTNSQNPDTTPTSAPQSPPRMIGIRSMDSSNDNILLPSGEVKTLVAANQIVDQSVLTAEEKRRLLAKKEKELDAAIAALDTTSTDSSYSITLPTTSLMTATLLSGMQAPTSIGSKREPLPAAMRIKMDVLLPNGYRVDLRDCQGLIAGVGSLSDRRAYMRLQTVVCIDEDGLTAEGSAKGFATGNDGQAGIPGTLVARNGEVLKGSMWAGFFSGLAQGIAPSRVVGIDVNDDGSGFQTPDMSTLGVSAGLNGASTALDRISEYYVKMLEEIWPTIDVPAMQEVTFILQAPLKLTFKEM